MGYTGLVKYLLENIRKELGSTSVAIATGGLSSVLEPLEDHFVEINKLLTLEGLLEIGRLELP